MLPWQVAKAETRNFWGILAVKACHSVLALFVNTFLVARIFVLSDGNYASVGLFILIEISARFIFHCISLYACKKIPVVWVTRISTVVMCGFLLLIILWQLIPGYPVMPARKLFHYPCDPLFFPFTQGWL